jgi:hypothetical protein
VRARRIDWVVPVVAVVTVAGLGLPARGQAAGTPCHFEVDASLAPGLSRTPSSGTFTSNGETGTISCDGPVNGEPPSSGGTLGTDGRYGLGGEGDSCRSERGEGDGTMHITVPTVSGGQHLDDPFTMTYALEGRRVVGRFTGRRFSGTFEITAARGDCFFDPITRVHLSGDGTLTG